MLWWLTQNAVMGGVLAVLVAVVCRLGHFRPAVRHALWLVVLVKLVAPPLIPWPWPAPVLTPEQSASAVTVVAGEEQDFPTLAVRSQEVFSSEALHAKWLSLEPQGILTESSVPEFRPIMQAPDLVPLQGGA